MIHNTQYRIKKQKNGQHNRATSSKSEDLFEVFLIPSGFFTPSPLYTTKKDLTVLVCILGG